LLETDQARTLVEGAEERGYIEPAEFEAFTLELDLNEEEVEELTRELERIGLEIGRAAELLAERRAKGPSTRRTAKRKKS